MRYDGRTNTSVCTLEERIKGASDELIATSMKFTLLEQNSNDVGMKLSTLPTTPVAPFNVQALYSHPPFAKKSPLKNRQLRVRL